MVEYNYKSVDWKAVKAEWDANPMLFYLKIDHKGVALSFQPYLDKSKRYRLSMYINNWQKGEWCLNKEHEYYKYHNKKKLPLRKSEREANERIAKHNKRARKEYRIDFPPYVPYSYATPGFDNITQIKRMVESLD